MLQDYIKGGLIMNYFILQILLLLITIITFLVGFNKKQLKLIKKSRLFLIILLFSSVIGFYSHINKFIHSLKKSMLLMGDSVSTDYILQGLEGKQIFIDYEIIFSLIVFILFFTLEYFLKKNFPEINVITK